MSLIYGRLRDSGKLETERLIFDVRSTTEVGDYAICRTKGDPDGTLYPLVTDTFWFPDVVVKGGDLIVLYTRAGERKSKVNSTASTSHFFYWGKTRPLWDGPDFLPVLMKLEGWTALTAQAEPADASGL